MRAVVLCAFTLAGALAVPALASAYVPPVRECGVYQVPRGPLVYNLTTRDYSCNAARWAARTYYTGYPPSMTVRHRVVRAPRSRFGWVNDLRLTRGSAVVRWQTDRGD